MALFKLTMINKNNLHHHIVQKMKKIKIILAKFKRKNYKTTNNKNI